jgi:hypothetical protein
MFIVNLVESSFVWILFSACILDSESLFANSCIELEATSSGILCFIERGFIIDGLLLYFQLDRDAWAKYFAVLLLPKGEDVFYLSLFLRRLNFAQLIRCQESVSWVYSTD